MRCNPRTVKRAAVLALLLPLACCTAFAPSVPSVPSAPSSQVVLGGLLEHSSTISAKQLSAYPEQQQSARYDSQAGLQTHAYQGILLYQLLEQGGIEAESDKLGGGLDRYVVARGADGYQVVYSMGELMTGFGHVEALIATRGDAAALHQDMLYSTAPGDAKGGRYVANLTSIEVRAPPPAVDPLAAPSGRVQLVGTVTKPLVIDASFLQHLPQVTEHVGQVDFVGVSLWTLLGEAGLRANPALKNGVLSLFVVAQGRDGYRAVFSAAELSPDFGGHQVLLGLALNDTHQAAGADGPLGLVVPSDQSHGRWVRDLVRLTVESAAPSGSSSGAPN